MRRLAGATWPAPRAFSSFRPKRNFRGADADFSEKSCQKMTAGQTFVAAAGRRISGDDMDTQLGRFAAAAVIAAIAISALFFASAVFVPVAFSLFAMAIVWPFQNRLQKFLPKGLALVATVLVTLVVFVTLSSVIAWGGGQIAHWLTANFDRVQALYASSALWLEQHDIFIASIVAERFDVGWLLRLFQQIAVRLNGLIGFSLLILIFLTMGLLEAGAFANNLRAVGDGPNGARLIDAGVKIGKKIRRFMLVRTLASLLTGLIVWLFALAVGLELAAAWGVMSFALNYIPFLGPLIATLLPTLFAFAQTGSWELAVLVLAALTVVQFLIGSYLEPLFTAKTLVISPFFVVFSVFFWSFLWGLPGTLIGVPIAIAGLTICAEYPASRWIAVLLSGQASDGGADGPRA
jgi:predicted PurR-regulated permease PerM